MENIKETIMENENVMDAVFDAVESGSGNTSSKGVIAGLMAVGAAAVVGVMFWRKRKAKEEEQQFNEDVVVEGEVVEVTDK